MKPPLYYIKTRELQIVPGVGLKAARPQLYILGSKIVTLPDQHSSFVGTGSSLNLPYPTFRSGSGLASIGAIRCRSIRTRACSASSPSSSTRFRFTRPP